MTPAKQLNLGVLLYGCGHHQAAWLMPESSIELIGNVTYYQELGKIAESGFLDAVFFADNQSFPATTSTEVPAFWFDPMINLTAISQVTNRIGLVSTISSTFSNPFTASRQVLSLDHISQGRVGWNLVTSMSDWEAENHGMDHLPSRERRYQKADEFAEVMDKLLLSWYRGDFSPNRSANHLINEQNIEPIDHVGTYFKVKGPSTTPSSPQGKPVSMQAGASDQGIELAAKYADAVYSVSWNLKQAMEYRNRLEQHLVKQNKPIRHIKIFPGLVTYIGRTKEEAYSKKLELDKRLPLESAIKQLSYFIGEDCSKWELDERVPSLPPIDSFTGPVGRYKTILEIVHDKEPTLRELLGYISAGGGHLTLIGTPEEIVDEMERWFNLGVADGFNLMPPTLPSGLKDFVELIIPELQKRGIFRKGYEGATLREHLDLVPPGSRDRSPQRGNYEEE